MANFEQIASDLDSVFASTSWTSNEIITYPSNFRPTEISSEESIVIELLPSTPVESYGADKQLKGLIIIQIYVPVNTGTKRIFQISDLLDAVLQKKQLGTSIETGTSFCGIKGVDSDNPSLYRGDYTLRFSSY